ncbi:MAG: glycoside hydrolase family 92 protein [Bacteroidales bacterium]|nr:glycoside hydrolase family 92 protein [Bacteroidales bacterium]
MRQICADLYHNTPDGLCGNEDCGQMSAWYVMSALGLYPVCPGSGQYVVGSPLFDKATIHLHNGKDIVINAKGQGANSCYVRSLRLDGAPYDKAYLTAEQLHNGCTLDFEMGSKPDKEWAATPDARPASSIDRNQQITIAPVFNDWQQSFDGERQVKIISGNKVFYTVDGTTPNELSATYIDPITVTDDAVIKAVALDTVSGRFSSVVTHRLTRTQTDRTLTYITQPAPQYSENGPTGLIDRLHGTSNYRIGGWQGWQEDCRVVVDLLDTRIVSAVDVECLENMKSWIFFPTRIEVEVSADNANWQPFGSIDNREFPTTLERQELSTVHNFVVNGTPTAARYVRIHARNFGPLPKWHISAGEQAWLFVDEIEVR